MEIELKPVDFVTVGTIGPKGKRIFHLQAGKADQVVSLIIEKEQAWALSDAIKELMSDLDERFPHRATPAVSQDQTDMELREPITPLFRVSQMALGYDDVNDLVVLQAQELLGGEDEGDLDTDVPPSREPSVVRLWCKREQLRALSQHAMLTVRAGRVDPKQNGRLVYYWT